jgi:protein-disulfide isomerase
MAARSCLFSRSALTALTLVLVAASAQGCDKLGMGGAKKEAKANPKACVDYSKKVCDEAGAESGTCTSVKAATDLMSPATCSAALADFAFTKAKLGDARKACDSLMTKLCAEIGDKTETCEMVKTQVKNFPPERCTMMEQHYAEVVADLKKREEKNKPLSADKIALIAKADAPAFGPEGAKVTVVEFSDFQCPFCSRAATAVEKVREKYKDRVRFVFRQFPLSFHQNARPAAEASLAANAQGKFWEYHDLLFKDQSKLDRASLEASAKQVGLDVAAFKKALDDKTFSAAVEADLKLGETVQVDGTPTLFLNGKRVADPTNFEEISKQIDAALAGS